MSTLQLLMIDNVYYGNSASTWLIAAAVFLVTLLSFAWIGRVVAKRLRALSERVHITLFEYLARLVAGTSFLSLTVFSLYLASHALELPESLRQKLMSAAFIVLILQIGMWISQFSSLAILAYSRLRFGHDPDRSTSTISALGLASFVAKGCVWIIVVLLILDNLGINITALVTGLGIGGVAVALAIQNILSDLMASLSIVMDKPFEVGDFIVVGDNVGAVEKIGIKTTRLRSLSGEQLIFSNSDLLNSRIRNYKRMTERRILFSCGVVYNTPPEKLREIPELLKQIVTSQSGVRFDRAHFKNFGDSSLNFEIVYFVLSPDYNLYMNIQQAINLQIFERFAAERIEFAFPTRTVYLQRQDSVR